VKDLQQQLAASQAKYAAQEKVVTQLRQQLEAAEGLLGSNAQVQGGAGVPFGTAVDSQDSSITAAANNGGKSDSSLLVASKGSADTVSDSTTQPSAVPGSSGRDASQGSEGTSTQAQVAALQQKLESARKATDVKARLAVALSDTVEQLKREVAELKLKQQSQQHQRVQHQQHQVQQEAHQQQLSAPQQQHQAIQQQQTPCEQQPKGHPDITASKSDGESLRSEVAQLRAQLQQAAVLLASGGPNISPAELTLLVERLQGEGGEV
jgi:hypothetical protein